MPSVDSLSTRRDLSVGRKKYAYYSLPAAEEAGLAGVSRLPRSMKVLLENLLRNEDGVSVTEADVRALAAWVENKGSVEHEIAFRPARVLMQDFTGVPAVVDVAALRNAMVELGGDPPLSGLKDQLRKREEGFSEKDLGYSGFLQFCKAAVARGVIDLTWDDSVGDYTDVAK